MTALIVRTILEVLGRPAENVTEALQMIVDKLKAEKELKLISSKIHDPVPAKGSKDLFTSFVELEVELPSVAHLFSFLFVYMPANIEITYPEKITLGNSDLSQLTNQLMHRLHQYDAISKNALNEREFAMKKLFEVAPHLFKKVEQQAQKEEKPAKTKKKSKKK